MPSLLFAQPSLSFVFVCLRCVRRERSSLFPESFSKLVCLIADHQVVHASIRLARIGGHSRLIDTLGDNLRPQVSATCLELDAAIASTLDNDDERQRLLHTKFQNCDLIRREKQSAKWRHVLRNLRGGGWGNKAMGENLQDMRQIRIDATTTTTNNQEIRKAATTYYQSPFEDFSENNLKDADYIDEMCGKQWDLWEYDNVIVNQEDVERIFSHMPRNKTCGRDMLVTEVWAAAIAADSRVAAHLAWAANQRIVNTAARLQPDGKRTGNTWPHLAAQAVHMHAHTTHARDVAPWPPHHAQHNPRVHSTRTDEHRHSTNDNPTDTTQHDIQPTSHTHIHQARTHHARRSNRPTQTTTRPTAPRVRRQMHDKTNQHSGATDTATRTHERATAGRARTTREATTAETATRARHESEQHEERAREGNTK